MNLRKIYDYLATSKLFWILAFVFTVWLMMYNGVWTDYTPAEIVPPIQ